MTRGFSGGKQVMKFASSRNGNRFVYSTQQEIKNIYLKDNNGKKWVEVIIAIILGAVATVYILTAFNNDVKLGEIRTVHFA